MSEHPEAALHREAVKLIQLMGLGSFVMHIPNAPRNAVAGRNMKLMGMRAGVSDLFLAYPCGSYHGLWIELKKPGETPRPSPAQRKFLQDMRKAGYATLLTNDIEELALCVRSYSRGEELPRDARRF